ncbi:putative cys met metabolism pyridoxal phosphate-dependent enzyme protein [Daldinia childiae]|uniref:putative cys met metabolism pyridoxal phosphate-dependent enzyme protein n=1 Tax=Daldinia childiae TaxID=326645 RepID=UPI0014456509|nr:putative cys met metabolism pyridoxal phosphate-dependent enzyme protein [Daldinia childiae]KAF3057462.1 putative cys met metabolism pyridoxal phosphate-dependent enzyme protein [Daldinia childiae]
MAKHDYPYKKSVNVTAWILQILVCLVLLAASAWFLWISEQQNLDEILGDYNGIFTASAGLQIGITGLNIVMNIVEIILISKKRMPPALFLTSTCIKTAIWGIIFILNVIARSALSIILTIVLFATSLIQLIHASIIVHRKRRGTLTRGKYAPAINPQGFEEGVYAQPTPGYYYPPPTNTEYKSPAATPPPPQYGNPAGDVYAPQIPPGSYELDSRGRNH